MSSFPKLYTDERGTSVVEVMVAIVVFMIIMIGGLQYYTLPQSTMVRQKLRRLAITAAQERMETLSALSYTEVTVDSNETDKAISLDSKSATRSTTVTEVDDAADGLGGSDSDGNIVDYKTISVQIDWNDGKAQTVSLVTRVSDVTYSVSGGSPWGRKCELVIQANKVPGNLTDFPVLLTEDTLPSEMFDADGSYPAANGGGDIKFTSDEDGLTRLSCEIVTFTIDNNPANGEAEIWVKVPSVSSSTNTSIWVWYDKSGHSQPAEDEPYGSESVWDSDFVLVEHMNEDPSGSAPQMIDATSNDNDGSSSGSMTSGDLINTQVGKGLDFDGSDDYISVPNNATLQMTSALTISGWIWGHSWSSGTEVDIMARKGTDNPNNYQLAITDGLVALSLDDDDNDAHEGTTTLSTGQWYHIAGAWDGSTVRIYLDGSLDRDPPESKSAPIGTDTRSLYMGGRDPSSANDNLNGRLDEVRISKIARSADWITSEYNNQNSPATFVIEGIPQTP